MTGSDRNKKRPTLMEGFNNVPKILEEARKTVDEMTQPTAGQDVPAAVASSQEKTPAKPAPRKAKSGTAKQKQGTRKQKSISQAPKEKKPAPKPKSKESSASPSPPAPERPRAPLRTLDYYGIKVRHRLYGRVRLRIRKMKYDSVLAEKIKRALSEVKGVSDVKASAATGSLLVIFNPKELAVSPSRQDFSDLIEGFFPGLDTEALIRKFL
jgi:hypothetical protein